MVVELDDKEVWAHFLQVFQTRHAYGVGEFLYCLTS